MGVAPRIPLLDFSVKSLPCVARSERFSHFCGARAVHCHRTKAIYVESDINGAGSRYFYHGTQKYVFNFCSSIIVYETLFLPP